MPEILLLRGAQVDILEAYAIFGDRFYERADTALAQLASHPETGPLFHGKYRRLVVRNTPFGIFYAIEGARVLVGAVLDLRQDPARILARLNEMA